MATETLKLLIQSHGMKNVKRALKDLDTAAGKTSNSFMQIATSMGLVVGAGIALRKVINTGKEFEEEMARTKSVTYDTSLTTEQLNAQWDRLEKNARRLGGSTLYTAKEVAGLQTEFAKLGFTVPEIENLSDATLSLALVAGVELPKAAEVSGQTLRAFGMDSTKATHLIDIMATSFSVSALDIDKFSNSMTYVAPVAAAAGFSVEETTAILGTLANVGIDGSIAGTQLRLVFGELANESSGLAQKLGGPIDNVDDLIPKLKEMKEDGFSVTEAFDLVGRRAGPALLALVENSDGLEEMTDKLDEAAGAAKKMEDTQLDTFAAQMGLLNSAADDLYITMFELVEDGLKPAVKWIREWVEDIDEEEIKSYAAGVTIAATAFATYKTYVMLAAWANNQFAISLTRTGIGALIVGLGIAIGGLLDYIGVFETATEKTKEQEEAERLLEERERSLNAEVDKTVKKYKDLGLEPSVAIELLQEKIKRAEQEQESWKQSTEDQTQVLNSQVNVITLAARAKTGFFDIGTMHESQLRKEISTGEDVLDLNNNLFGSYQGLGDSTVYALQPLDDYTRGLNDSLGIQTKTLDNNFELNKSFNDTNSTFGDLNLVYGSYYNNLNSLNDTVSSTAYMQRFLAEEQLRSNIRADEGVQTTNEQIKTNEENIQTKQDEIEVYERSIAELEKIKAAQNSLATMIESVNEVYDKKVDTDMKNREGMTLEILATQAQQKGWESLTTELREQIRARVESGESMDSIVHGLGLEKEGTKTLAAQINEYNLAVAEKTEKDAVQIALKNDLLTGTEQEQEAQLLLIEGYINEGASIKEINYMLENKITKYEDLNMVEDDRMERIKEAHDTELLLLEEKEDILQNYYDNQNTRWFEGSKLESEVLSMSFKDFNTYMNKRAKVLEDQGIAEKKTKIGIGRFSAEIDWQTAKAKMTYGLKATQATLGSLAGGWAAMAKVDARYAKDAKNMAIAMAIMDTGVSMQKTAASVPYPLNILAVAGAAAQGYAQVQQIKKQDFGPPKDPKVDDISGGTDPGKITITGGPNQFGGEHLVTKPTSFTVGEGGAPERVSVSPLTVANAKTGIRRGTMGGGNVTLNVTAPLVDEHILETILPEIRRAMRHGESFED